MFEFRDIDHYQAVWRSGGRDPLSTESDPKKGRVELRDAIATPNAPLWLPKTVTNIVREAIEPLLVGTSLLTRIQYVPGMQIAFPTMTGVLHAADVMEGMAYPERQLTIGGSEAQARIGKSGVAIAITEEMVRYSQFDVIGMHLRAAGAALARHKEQKVFKLINDSGVVIFDNHQPTNSLLGVTHGRSLTGAGNGSMTLDDIFDMYVQIQMQGYTPDTLLVHPLTWVMFVKDPMTRHFALTAAQGPWFNRWTGNVTSASATNWGTFGGLGRGAGQNFIPGGNAGGATPTALTEINPNMNTAPIIPAPGLGFPLRILISPLVPFDIANKVTNIFMFQSGELGALVEDESVTMDEWTDQSVDMRKMKFRERYALAMLNEGQAVGIAKNVKVIANELVMPVQATYDVSGTFLPLDPGTPLV